jgi:hypothetical protein
MIVFVPPIERLGTKQLQLVFIEGDGDWLSLISSEAARYLLP